MAIKTYVCVHIKISKQKLTCTRTVFEVNAETLELEEIVTLSVEVEKVVTASVDVEVAAVIDCTRRCGYVVTVSVEVYKF